ncbi:hypothetical protein ACIBSW_27230 [Actinoplanes sp. NPDC049668]|uniref:hypothetical protein n=1 Tax=Actinoplanes sp. NPDC049668 TaxID=3363904 RepID=UPI003796B528
MRDAFIDLVCQDDDLLRADFDALVAASWHPRQALLRQRRHGAPARGQPTQLHPPSTPDGHTQAEHPHGARTGGSVPLRDTDRRHPPQPSGKR